jgi:hypothetical protein
MRANPRDVVCGLLFVALGFAFVAYAAAALAVGQAFAMGPGYFPIALGLVLAALGGGIAWSAGGRRSPPFPAVPWRGVLLVVGSVLVFAATVRGIGLAPSLALAAFAAAMASGRMSAIGAVVLGLALSGFCVAVFVYALGLPYPVIGPWLGG